MIDMQGTWAADALAFSGRLHFSGPKSELSSTNINDPRCQLKLPQCNIRVKHVSLKSGKMQSHGSKPIRQVNPNTKVNAQSKHTPVNSDHLWKQLDVHKLFLSPLLRGGWRFRSLEASI